MDFINYYKVMGVAEHATQTAIKQAYRRLARKFHPDVSQERDADAQFKSLGAAYAVLKDVRKRREYDLSRCSGRHTSARTVADLSDNEFSNQCADCFTSGTGQADHQCQRPTIDLGAAAPVRHRGQDRHHRLILSLEDAVRGIQRTLKLNIPAIAASGHQHAQTKTLKVRIPAGVVAGQRIRLAGQGGPGLNGGAAGDLLLEIELSAHPLFSLIGRDILLSLPVTNWEVALAAKVRVPTLTGMVNLSIPQGWVSGRKLRLKGRGLGLNPSGDLIVSLQVTIPERHWTKAENLYREVAAF